MASGVVVAAATGGPVGLAVLGGLAALAAAEYAGAGRDRLGRPENLADVGRPSEVALRALDRIEHEERGDAPPDDSPNDPWRDDPGRDDAGRGAG